MSDIMGICTAEEIVPVEETLSDVDMDMEEFIVRDNVELKTKTEMWDTINKDWIEAQELKKAQLEEAHQVTLTHNLLCLSQQQHHQQQHQ